MHSIPTKIRTAWSLGPSNIWRVQMYRLLLQRGLHPVQRIKATIPFDQAFFRHPTAQPEAQAPSINPKWQRRLCYFDWLTIDNPDNQPPDWFHNPFNGRCAPEPHRPWWKIPDFDPQNGDLKTVWEMSRFGWLFTFAQQAVQGEATALDTLNHWLQDWARHNPPYLGPNWKCGQEASIRVMHLAMATILLHQTKKTEPVLLSLIEAHLRRIAPTIGYAMAQNNNHGTSEAAALFIGGSWLAQSGNAPGEKWALRGRRWLEDRARKLIAPDGSFSQYSINYHRLMLDTYCMAEEWRRCLALPRFSDLLYKRLEAATDWLQAMVQPETGDAPNLGANDGARLLPLTDTDYRDFRPSLARAKFLFHSHEKEQKGIFEQKIVKGEKELYYSHKKFIQPFSLQVAGHENTQKGTLKHFPDGGYFVLRTGASFVLMRYPCFRFRPSHADALHVDFWHGGQNILRDGGSFSYADPKAMEYFPATSSHNTIQFDGRNQMPQLGRFLFGDWLQAKAINPPREESGKLHAEAGYTDAWGVSHHRTVELTAKKLTVQDTVSGFREQAVLRWRLRPGAWRLTEDGASDGEYNLSVTADVPVVKIELTTGLESRHYLKQTELPVLQVILNKPGVVRTKGAWAASP